jgi:hypothetical protein
MADRRADFRVKQHGRGHRPGFFPAGVLIGGACAFLAAAGLQALLAGLNGGDAQVAVAGEGLGRRGDLVKIIWSDGQGACSS